MKKKVRQKKGVRYFITREMIREYRRLTPEMRLAWLQEATVLSYYGLTKKRRRIWDKIRAGEI